MRFVKSLILSLVLAAMATHAHACTEIPDNKVWGNVSNGAIQRFVETQYNGDWARYVKKWQSRLNRVEEIAAKGAMLVFHESGLWLRDDDLKQYLRDVRTRLDATKCMAAKSDGAVPGEAFVGIPVPGGGS